jgi:mannose-6-phosphate isomerase-like protein (cupin superfamily)
MKTVARSWGSYTELFRCRWLCVKILSFIGGSQMSAQRHSDRSELWLWLIKPKQWHTFKSPVDCKILEIQFGKNVREDDIERV